MVKKNAKLISKIKKTNSLVDFYKLKEDILKALEGTSKANDSEGGF